MSLPVFSKSLVEAIGAGERAVFDYAMLVRLLRAIEARLKPLEDQTGSLEEAIEAVRKVGLDRINEVLVPAIQLILEFQSKGFLIARSSTPATLGNGNILTLIVGEEQGRAVFTPAPFIALTREATADDYAICRTISYVQESGVLVCEVAAYAGSPGPHADWVIGALAGSTIAQQTMLAAAEALLGDTQDARDAAMGYRNQADDHATSAADEKDLAIAARNAAEGFAGAAADARNTALTYRDQASASAAIAASAAGQALDVLDRVDIPASLVLDFTDPNGAPYKGNFTRATGGGYRLNAKGVYVPTGNNEPVIDYGSDGKPKGTGFFGAYTNLLTYSEQFDNAAWTKVNCTISANSVASPDGNATADNANATVGNDGFFQSAAMTGGSTTIHTASIFLKQGTAAKTTLRIDFATGGTANSAAATITWSTLAVAVGGTANNKSYDLLDLGNGWYRFSISGANSGGANTSVALVVLPADTATGTVDAWGAQLTATAFPVPYVPTTSAAVVRNADTMVISGADFTDFFNPLEGTIFADFTNPEVGPVMFPYPMLISDGTGNNRIGFVQVNATGALTAVSRVGGVNVGSIPFTSANGASIRAAFSYKVDDFKAAVNGVTGADASGALPSGLGRLSFNEAFTSFRRVIYWPKALSATDLQRITA